MTPDEVSASSLSGSARASDIADAPIDVADGMGRYVQGEPAGIVADPA